MVSFGTRKCVAALKCDTSKRKTSLKTETIITKLRTRFIFDQRRKWNPKWNNWNRVRVRVFAFRIVWIQLGDVTLSWVLEWYEVWISVPMKLKCPNKNNGNWFNCLLHWTIWRTWKWTQTFSLCVHKPNHTTHSLLIRILTNSRTMHTNEWMTQWIPLRKDRLEYIYFIYFMSYSIWFDSSSAIYTVVCCDMLMLHDSMDRTNIG